MISFQKISTYFFLTGRSDLRRYAPSSVAVFNHFCWRPLTQKPLLLSFFSPSFFSSFLPSFSFFFLFSPSLLSFACFLQSNKFSATLRVKLSASRIKNPYVSPWGITLRYHPEVSPWGITLRYHPEVSPWGTTLKTCVVFLVFFLLFCLWLTVPCSKP